MRVTPNTRAALASEQDSTSAFFYIDEESKFHLGRHSSVSSIEELHSFGFLSPKSDNFEDVKTAFEVAKEKYPSAFGRDKNLDVINKLMAAGHMPFVKVKLGSLNHDVFSYLPQYSDDNVGRMLPTIRKLIDTGVVDVNIKEHFIYTPIVNENFETLFNIPVPASTVIPFNLARLSTISEFLCTTFKQSRLTYNELAILNEFLLSMDDSSKETLLSLISEADAATIKEGFDRLPAALERAEKNKLYDLLIDLSESVRSTGELINSYRSIFSPELFDRIAEKYFAIPMTYQTAVNFSDVIDSISGNKIALMYTRKLYSYIFNLLTCSSYSQPVGFLGIVTSLNTNYLSNLIPAEFLATMVSEITKHRESFPSRKSVNTAGYISLILKALNEDDDYDLLYSRVTTLASMAMAAIREETVVDIYSHLTMPSTESLTLLNGSEHIDSLDRNGLLANIHQKIYTAEGFVGLLQTLDLNKTLEHDSIEHISKVRNIKDFLDNVNSISTRHCSPVTAVLSFGDITPETILRLQRNFQTKPTLLATFMDETLLFMKQDTVMAHPVYKYICDFNILRDINRSAFSEFDFTVMAGSMHFFMHVPEFWTVVMLLAWFATDATYEYLGVPKIFIDNYIANLNVLTNEVRIMGTNAFNTPFVDVVSYLDPVVAFYKSSYDVWTEDSPAIDLKPSVMSVAVTEPERGSLSQDAADHRDVTGSDESIGSSSN